jgi:hypothetical protein
MPRVSHVRVMPDPRALRTRDGREYLRIPGGVTLPRLRAWWRWA